MKKHLLLIILISTLCAAKAQTTIVDSIISGGIYRSYRLYKPAIYSGTTARPLIINMHGYTSNASDQQLYTNFKPIADTANFLMVYPNGTYNSGQRYWNAGISSSGVDDIGFISHLIDSLKLQFNINSNRIYATGMSNGGYMSNTLACELSTKITAIASVTGSMFTTQYGFYGSACHPTRPIPYMQVHGTADPTVPYAGNTGSLPIDSVVKYWVRKNVCNTTPTFSNVPNTNTSDGCTAEHYIYNGGKLGSTVELYKIIGGQHTWPGAPITIGVTNQDMNASKEIWRFFNKYNLASLTGIDESSDNKLNFSIYPNPANSIINIDFLDVNNKPYHVKILNTIGQIMLEETTNSPSLMLQTENLKSGIYLVTLTNADNFSVTKKIIKE